MNNYQDNIRYIKKIKDKCINFEPLELYKGNSEKIRHKCLICNYDNLYITPECLYKGVKCKNCIKNKKTYEYLKKIKESKFILKGIFNGVSIKTSHLCKVCNYEQDIKPSLILKSSGCSNCSGIRKKTHEEYILDLVEKNKNIIYLDIYISANKKISHKCLICENIWKSTPNNLLMGQGCGRCSNNERKTTEQYKKELINKGKKIIVLSEYINRYTKIKHCCEICKNEFIAEPSAILSSSSQGCQKCKINSKGEKIIENYLYNTNIKYIKQFKFKECKNIRQLSFDFYLPEYNTCIEYDGIQHFKPNRFGALEEEFEKILCNDNIKNNWCSNNGIILIRIPYFEEINIEKILNKKIK